MKVFKEVKETENSKLQQFNGAVLMTGLINEIDEMKLFEDEH